VLNHNKLLGDFISSAFMQNISVFSQIQMTREIIV
jgi:hypothetical protein